MYLKSVVMLSLFLVPIIIVSFGLVSSVYVLFLLFLISAVGNLGVGMGVMHDANHGSFSSNPKLNKILGYSLNLIGANATVWKVQHNVLHHTYTNIHEADDDINVPEAFLRFSPNAKRKFIHRYQYIYVWFFYGISTLSWIISNDYIRFMRFYKAGHMKNKSVLVEFAKITIWKILYFTLTLVLPIMYSGFDWDIIVYAFLMMHFITGLMITSVFQVAHIMPENEFPFATQNGEIQEYNWAIHQMKTTMNFSPNSRFVTWIFGGLNYQIEHHLFPNICHVHYSALSKIVKQTAKEFEVEYQCQKSFLAAIIGHVKMLKLLGSEDLQYKRN